MKRHELVIAATAAVLMVTAGLTWRFGFYGLVGVGAVVLMALFFIDERE